MGPRVLDPGTSSYRGPSVGINHCFKALGVTATIKTATSP
jgi:hypothetical protein